LLGHPRLPRAQSRPSASIGQVKIRLNSLCVAGQINCRFRLHNLSH
jgi:hypothetical protein